MLVVDGVFLHVSDDVSVARARVRDADELGSREAVETRYRNRYLPGQALYRQEARPLEHAHVVIDNTVPEAPEVLWCSPTAAPSGSPRPAG